VSDDIEQGSEAWKLSRVGRIGCSRLGDVLASGKGGAPSATRANYMAELLCERLTGKYADHYTTPEMIWGLEHENAARSLYEARKGIMVIADGGREHPTIKGFGCSPDGLVGDDGGIEIKCPLSKKHIATLLEGKIDRDYIMQMAGGILCYDRKYWDFISYDPRLPENLQLYVKRFTRDELPIDEVKEGVLKFLSELDELESKVKAISN
jgi:hypothetical protein